MNRVDVGRQISIEVAAALAAAAFAPGIRGARFSI